MLALLSSAPACAAPFSLADALAVAYQTNPQLLSARAALDALDQGVAQANAGWRPSINASGTYGFERGAVQGIASPFVTWPITAQVTVTEPIFRGGRTLAELRRAITLVRAGRAQLLSVEQQVLLNAATAYEDVVRDTAIERLNSDNVRSLELELRAATTELTAGDVTRTDELQAEARLSRARADLALAQSRLAASRAEYEAVIGRPAETLMDDGRPPVLPVTRDAALDLALRQNPDLMQAKYGARAADYAVEDAAGALLPQVSVSGQYQFLQDASGTNIFATKKPQAIVNVLAQVTIPIYQGGGDEATVRRARDVARQTSIDIATAERGVRQDLDSAWQAFLSGRLALASSVAEANADQAAMAGVQEERRGGERTELDVLNAEQEYVSAQVSAASARHDYLLAAYRVMAATGQLTAQRLSLNVTLYDPAKHYAESADAWFGFDE